MNGSRGAIVGVGSLVDASGGEGVRLLLTTNEAAKALSICPRTLWTLTHAGQIPFVRIGRLVRYSPDDLRGWIDRQKSAIRQE